MLKNYKGVCYFNFIDSYKTNIQSDLFLFFKGERERGSHVKGGSLGGGGWAVEIEFPCNFEQSFLLSLKGSKLQFYCCKQKILNNLNGVSDCDAFKHKLPL